LKNFMCFMFFMVKKIDKGDEIGIIIFLVEGKIKNHHLAERDAF